MQACALYKYVDSHCVCAFSFLLLLILLSKTLKHAHKYIYTTTLLPPVSAQAVLAGVQEKGFNKAWNRFAKALRDRGYTVKQLEKAREGLDYGSRPSQVGDTRLQTDLGEGVGLFRVRAPSLRCCLGGLIKGLPPFWLLSPGAFSPRGGWEGGCQVQGGVLHSRGLPIWAVDRLFFNMRPRPLPPFSHQGAHPPCGMGWPPAGCSCDLSAGRPVSRAWGT